MKTTRRGFLKGLAATGTIAGLTVPRAAQATLTSAEINCEDYKILEIFLQTGVSHRDSLWIEDPNVCTWEQAPTTASIDASLVGVGNTLVATAVGGQDIYMGPCIDPINGTDLLDRMRVVTLQHTLTPHGPATAYGLTGINLGRPAFAGLGARVEAMHGNGVDPVSYVIDANNNIAAYVGYALATGQLGIINQPFLIPFGNMSFVSNLNRSSFANTETLFDYYRDLYDERLTHSGPGRVRSAHFDIYSSSVTKMQNSSSVQTLLSSFTFGGADSSYEDNRMTRAVPLAVHLLNNGARHICLLARRGYQTFDTHTTATYAEHATFVNGNLWGLFKALNDELANIDLDNTLIVIHTEFGRGGPESDGDGTYHWPYGYPALLIGGPVDTASPTIAGDITYGTSVQGNATVGFTGATQSWNPADLMAGLTLAAGIDPFQPDLFQVADTTLDPALYTESQVVEKLKTELFGVTLTGVPC